MRQIQPLEEMPRIGEIPEGHSLLILAGRRPMLLACLAGGDQAELALMTPDRLRECLTSLRWSQRELAKVLDIDEARVRRWARGAAPIPQAIEPWLESLAAVHNALPLPPGWHDGGEKKP